MSVQANRQPLIFHEAALTDEEMSPMRVVSWCEAAESTSLSTSIRSGSTSNACVYESEKPAESVRKDAMKQAAGLLYKARVSTSCSCARVIGPSPSLAPFSTGSCFIMLLWPAHRGHPVGYLVPSLHRTRYGQLPFHLCIRNCDSARIICDVCSISQVPLVSTRTKWQKCTV